MVVVQSKRRWTRCGVVRSGGKCGGEHEHEHKHEQFVVYPGMGMKDERRKTAGRAGLDGLSSSG